MIVLVKLGAAPGAVQDPTSAFPRGHTAADLASSRGHKGIAGYLAEADLESQLSILSTVNENEMYNIVTTTEADNAFESAEGDSPNMTMDEQHCMKESLVALRKSAHAAASIQAAFRARSFCQRQLAKSSSDNSEAVLDLVADSLNKVQNMGHFEDYLHFAALRIQKRYRGWKGRKDFLKIRNRIIKIQVFVHIWCILLSSWSCIHASLLHSFHDYYHNALLSFLSFGLLYGEGKFSVGVTYNAYSIYF